MRDLVVRGEPTDTELAAVVAVLTARLRRRRPGAGATALSAWRDRAAALGPPPRPGPDAWRASGLPVRR